MFWFIYLLVIGNQLIGFDFGLIRLQLILLGVF